jgi:hypothetical protein
MERRHPLHTHVWADGDMLRQTTQDGKIIFHHRCVRCGRDFRATDRPYGGSANRAPCGQRGNPPRKPWFIRSNFRPRHTNLVFTFETLLI